MDRKKKYLTENSSKLKKSRRLDKTTKSEGFMTSAKKYASNSSIHGVQYLFGRKQSSFGRFCWIGFVIAAILGTTFQVWSIWKESDSDPIVTTLKTTSYPIEDIDYPAVTLCPQGSIQEIMDAALFNQFEEWLVQKRKKDIFFD